MSLPNYINKRVYKRLRAAPKRAVLKIGPSLEQDYRDACSFLTRTCRFKPRRNYIRLELDTEFT